MLTKEQLKQRKAGLGGSDVAAILGLSKWRSPVEVYLDKIGQLPPLAENEAMRWGSLLEPVVVSEFERRKGLTVKRTLPMVVSERHPFMLATLDGLASDGGIVEAKTARSGDDWGDDGSADVPACYHAQVAHYMAVTGAQFAYVPVLIGAADFRIYTVPRDEAFVSDLVEAEQAFWFDHVLAKVPPAPVSASDAALLWARDRGTSVEAPQEVADRVYELKALKAHANEVDRAMTAAEDAIRIAFADAATLTYNGAVLATYKTQSARRFDIKAFEAAHADMAAAFRKESISRVLRLK